MISLCIQEDATDQEHPVHNKTATNLVRQNLRLVKQLYPELPQEHLTVLGDLTRTLRLSVSRGEILCIDGKWYVTHAGLLRIALRRRCLGIRTILQERLCDPVAGRWVFKATVYKTPHSRGFVGYGDADPSNVSLLVRGAEMQVAETRAVNRALRKAYGIGPCPVEEVASFAVRGSDQLQPAILPVGLSSLSPIERGLPCGRSHFAPVASASGSAPSRPSVLGERRAGFSLSSSPCASPNLIPSPRANATKHLTLLSA